MTTVTNYRRKSNNLMQAHCAACSSLTEHYRLVLLCDHCYDVLLILQCCCCSWWGWGCWGWWRRWCIYDWTMHCSSWTDRQCSLLQQWSRWTDHGQRPVTGGRSTYKPCGWRTSFVLRWPLTTCTYEQPIAVPLQDYKPSTAWTHDNCRRRSTPIRIPRTADCVVLALMSSKLHKCLLAVASFTKKNVGSFPLSLELFIIIQFSSVHWFHAAVKWQNDRTNM